MRDIKELARLPESELTPEEKIRVYGPGCSNVVMYRVVTTGKGSKALVSRTFGAGELIPDDEGWVDTPAKLGAPDSHPERAPGMPDPTETVIGVLPDGFEDDYDPGADTAGIDREQASIDTDGEVVGFDDTQGKGGKRKAGR